VKACTGPVLPTALDPTRIAKRDAAFALLHMVVLQAWEWRTSRKTQIFRFLFPLIADLIAERSVALRDQQALQLDATHPGHPHVRDQARRVVDAARLEKILDRGKRAAA
jgi:hypothetical protein